MKRVVTVQDISCIGKCSLTVALPVISAAGIETAVIPTAVLSTHTAFSRFEFTDLTDKIVPITEHWKEEGIVFDAVYTGYLGSVKQLDIVGGFIDNCRKDGALAVVDPVMGDNGRLYSGFDRDFAGRMAALCRKADIILPNLTEAAYLLGLDEVPADPSADEVKDMLIRLTGAGTPAAIMTGVHDRDKLGALGYDSRCGRFFGHFCDRIDAAFHGTGDVFASAFVASLMHGCDMQAATENAVEFTAHAIRLTVDDPDARWYGVNFEAALPWLTDRFRERNGE